MVDRYNFIAVLIIFIALPVASLASIEEKNTSPEPIAASLDDDKADKNNPVTNTDTTTTNKERGQLLYENHCTLCHDSIVHIRKQRKVRSVNDIRQWAVRWSTHLKLDWNDDDVDIVTRYVNRQFYHFK